MESCPPGSVVYNSSLFLIFIYICWGGRTCRVQSVPLARPHRERLLPPRRRRREEALSLRLCALAPSVGGNSIVQLTNLQMEGTVGVLAAATTDDEGDVEATEHLIADEVP